VFLGYWLLLQVLSASLTPSHVGGIAWWAHIGGFVSGFIFLKILDVIPRAGLEGGLRRYTERRTTPRLQAVIPHSLPEALDLYALIEITSREADNGARKLITIPQGLKKRSLIVTIPPGVREGTRLRLKGLGQKDDKGNQGDLFLEVRVKD
jgi:curved DNA-binding protein CbpA